MLDHDEPMVLVVVGKRYSNIMGIYYLGNATLDATEIRRINHLVEQSGCYAYTTTVEETRTSFTQLYAAVQKVVKVPQ